MACGQDHVVMELGVSVFTLLSPSSTALMVVCTPLEKKPLMSVIIGLTFRHACTGGSRRGGVPMPINCSQHPACGEDQTNTQYLEGSTPHDQETCDFITQCDRHRPTRDFLQQTLSISWRVSSSCLTKTRSCVIRVMVAEPVTRASDRYFGKSAL
jgi:hypothetical protein